MKRFLHAAETSRSTKTPSPRRPRRAMPKREDDGRAVPWWRRQTTIAIAVTATIALSAASCGSSPAETAPVSSAGSGGEALYQSNCSSCHGADLRGTDKGPSHLSIVYEPNHHGDDSFRSAIVNGAQQHHWEFGDMAAIPGLDEDEIDAVIGYIRAEQERQGFDQ